MLLHARQQGFLNIARVEPIPRVSFCDVQKSPVHVTQEPDYVTPESPVPQEPVPVAPVKKTIERKTCPQRKSIEENNCEMLNIIASYDDLVMAKSTVNLSGLIQSAQPITPVRRPCNASKSAIFKSLGDDAINLFKD